MKKTAAPAKPAAKAAPAKAAPAKTGAKAPAKKADASKKEQPKEVPKVEESKEEVPKVVEQPKKEYPKVPEKEIENLLEDFRTIDYLKLSTYLDAAALSGKYCLIFDQTGKVPDFLEYKGVLVDLHKEIVNCRLGLKTQDEIFELMRLKLVNAMRLGGNLALNIDKLDDVAWEQEWTRDGFFPLMAFNSFDWREEENYKTVVRPEEDKGFMDNDDLVEQRFEMKEKFNLSIICCYDGDD